MEALSGGGDTLNEIGIDKSGEEGVYVEWEFGENIKVSSYLKAKGVFVF